jgi:predicted lipoprotein
MKRSGTIVARCAGIAVLLWFFPLFHIVPVRSSNEAATAAMPMDAAEIASGLWTDRVPSALTNAADANEVFALFKRDAKEARTQFGRSLGIGASAFYLLKGEGRIVSVDRKGVAVALTDGSAEAEVSLKNGLIFGNTVRDSLGLVRASDYPNSQDFNDLSAELNKRVEAEVLPGLKERAAEGGRIRFVACVELADDAELAAAVKLIPLRVEFPK